MTPEKLKSILNSYPELIETRYPVTDVDVGPAQMDEKYMLGMLRDVPWLNRARHVCWMCLEAQRFVDRGRGEKAMRWLGFIQCWLWQEGYRTLDQLKQDSTPLTVRLTPTIREKIAELREIGIIGKGSDEKVGTKELREALNDGFISDAIEELVGAVELVLQER